jgi:DNA polymerase III subunit delta
MAKALHAIDFLAAAAKYPPKAVCVAFGDEAFLKGHVLSRIRDAVLTGDDSDFSLSVFEGPKANLAEVLDRLATLVMFGDGQRLVIVEDADKFVTRYRGELEDYVSQPAAGGILVLALKSWPANTRLYKAVAASGLAIACSAPTPAKLARWLVSWSKQAHRVELQNSAAEQLIEMLGPELGLLDQEISRLALTTAAGGKITAATVKKTVGSWRAKTTWDMLDAALEGKARDAMLQLDRLLLAGENPIAVLAQISATLRRFAAATRLVLQAEQAGRRVGLRATLEQAGFKPFVLKKAEQQLRQLGRQRGQRLYGWILEADLDLKGNSSVQPRLILERLVLRLATGGKKLDRSKATR